jgi:hypothetical protein
MNYEDYYTPKWVYQSLDKYVDFSRFKTALEPCCGDERVANFIQSKGIQTDRGDLQQGFNYLKQEDKYYDLIITNPPFTKAIPILTKALRNSSCCIFLLRLGILASQERNKFWIANHCSNILILSKRPSFKYGGTDNSECAWFIWDKTKPPITMDFILPC